MNRTSICMQANKESRQAEIAVSLSSYRWHSRLLFALNFLIFTFQKIGLRGSVSLFAYVCECHTITVIKSRDALNHAMPCLRNNTHINKYFLRILPFFNDFYRSAAKRNKTNDIGSHLRVLHLMYQIERAHTALKQTWIVTGWNVWRPTVCGTGIYSAP